MGRGAVEWFSESDFELAVFMATRNRRKVLMETPVPTPTQLWERAYDRETERLRVYLRGQRVAYLARRPGEYQFTDRQLQIAAEALQKRKAS